MRRRFITGVKMFSNAALHTQMASCRDQCSGEEEKQEEEGKRDV